MKALAGVLTVIAPAVLVLAPAAAPAGPAPDVLDEVRRVVTQSGPRAHEEPPHHEAMHEWWYFTVQNPDGGGDCGPWQAMVTFLADAEAVEDHLLFTTIVDGEARDRTLAFPPGSLTRATTDAGPGTALTLGDSRAAGAYPTWSLTAVSGEATLDVDFEATAPLWHRRAPEGGGVLEITFATRAAVSGALTIGERVCEVTGTGYFEHVWGTWSRVPQWGVDYLNIHLPGGWSAYARRNPFRFADRSDNPAQAEPGRLSPPVLIVSDGERMFEAREVSFEMEGSAEPHPDLGIPVPVSYTVVGTGFIDPVLDVVGPARVAIEVSAIELATIFLERTSSGVLEGWGRAAVSIDDGDPVIGTSEVEFQRFGTAFPH